MDETPTCYVCHEIGRGHYFAYLWGRDAADFFRLPSAGHLIATNLHADTLDEAESQLVDDCGVAPGDFRRMSIVAFMTVTGGWSGHRRITTVHESDGTPHRRLFEHDPSTDTYTRVGGSSLVTAEDERAAASLLDSIVASGVHTVEDVRCRLLELRA
jgi:hypothetical protein